jgi:hypothetical protein
MQDTRQARARITAARRLWHARGIANSYRRYPMPYLLVSMGVWVGLATDRINTQARESKRQIARIEEQLLRRVGIPSS